MAIPDLADTDQQLMDSLDWMLKNPIKDLLDLDYTYETETFGNKYTLSLIEPDDRISL